jgi:6-phosphogluconolactonase (cycloisomerase 2 family)
LAGASAYNLNVTPNGRCLVAPDDRLPGDNSIHQVFAFRVNSGNAALKSVPGSPFQSETLNTGAGMAVSNNLAFVYGFNLEGTKDVQAYRIGNDCRLAALGAAQGSGLKSLEAGAMTSNNQFLLLASSEDAKLDAFRINAGTGALTPLTSGSLPGASSINAVVIGRR